MRYGISFAMAGAAMLCAITAYGQSTPAYPPLCGASGRESCPTNTGPKSVWIANVYTGGNCNKYLLSNGQTWAINSFDANAYGRNLTLTQIWGIDRLGATKASTVSFLASSDPLYAENIPISPVTYCAGGDGTVKIFPNPGAISVGGSY